MMIMDTNMASADNVNNSVSDFNNNMNSNMDNNLNTNVQNPVPSSNIGLEVNDVMPEFNNNNNISNNLQ